MVEDLMPRAVSAAMNAATAAGSAGREQRPCPAHHALKIAKSDLYARCVAADLPGQDLRRYPARREA